MVLFGRGAIAVLRRRVLQIGRLLFGLARVMRLGLTSRMRFRLTALWHIAIRRRLCVSRVRLRRPVGRCGFSTARVECRRRRMALITREIRKRVVLSDQPREFGEWIALRIPGTGRLPAIRIIRRVISGMIVVPHVRFLLLSNLDRRLSHGSRYRFRFGLRQRVAPSPHFLWRAHAEHGQSGGQHGHDSLHQGQPRQGQFSIIFYNEA